MPNGSELIVSEAAGIPRVTAGDSVLVTWSPAAGRSFPAERR
jgi:hypothetical protein